MLNDPMFITRLILSLLLYLFIFLLFVKIISKFRKRPMNGAKAYLWCVGVFFLIGIFLFIRGVSLGYWSEYEQGQIIGLMLFGFTIPAAAAYFFHRRFLHKQRQFESNSIN